MTRRPGERTSGGDPSAQRRGVVDYALQRRARLAALFAGRASRHDVCDAHPYLLRAARFHGLPCPVPCPVCAKDDLRQVSYVYGDALKTTSGQAKSPAELAELAARTGEFTVYQVEVCRDCGWNHLMTSFVLGRVSAGSRGRRVATE